MTSKALFHSLPFPIRWKDRELLHHVVTITAEHQTLTLTFSKYNLKSTKRMTGTGRIDGFITLNELELGERANHSPRTSQSACSVLQAVRRLHKNKQRYQKHSQPTLHRNKYILFLLTPAVYLSKAFTVLLLPSFTASPPQ